MAIPTELAKTPGGGQTLLLDKQEGQWAVEPRSLGRKEAGLQKLPHSLCIGKGLPWALLSRSNIKAQACFRQSPCNHRSAQVSTRQGGPTKTCAQISPFKISIKTSTLKWGVQGGETGEGQGYLC